MNIVQRLTKLEEKINTKEQEYSSKDIKALMDRIIKLEEITESQGYYIAKK